MELSDNDCCLIVLSNICLSKKCFVDDTESIYSFKRDKIKVSIYFLMFL